MKNPILLLSSLFLVIALILPSCSSDEPEMIVNLENQVTHFNPEDYQEITFEVTTDSEMKTRCIPTPTGSSLQDLSKLNFTSDEYCGSKNGEFDLELLMFENNNTIEYLTYNSDNEITNVIDNQHITFVKKLNTNKFSIGVRFLRSIDPSKIRVVFHATKSKIKISNYEQGYQNIILSGQSQISYYCDFICDRLLCDTKDWQNVNPNFILKRNSCNIIVLAPVLAIDNLFLWDRCFQGKYCKYDENWIACSININENLNVYASASVNWTANQIYSFVNQQNNINTIYLSKNRGFTKRDVNIRRINEDDTKEREYWILNYKGKQYFVLYTDSYYAGETPSFPIYKNEEPIKYISIICHNVIPEINNNDSHSDYSGSNTDERHKYEYWIHNISLPENGIQANKNYVFILNDSFNYQTNYNLETRSETSTQTEKLDPTEGFELLEFDMDEPLPFETVEQPDEI